MNNYVPVKQPSSEEDSGSDDDQFSDQPRNSHKISKSKRVKTKASNFLVSAYNMIEVR